MNFRKPTKTLSGVTPLAVMVKPRSCKHGTCVYCPSLNAPQSYTPESPAVLRAAALNYDPYKQVKARLKAFRAMNHPTDKIELIIMGGTFPSYPLRYQKKFVEGCFNALNGSNCELKKAQKINENAKNRCVAFCIETRPDVCGRKEINRMLEFGATRCELGVQILDDEIYKLINRGHKVEDVVKATKLLKDSCYKVFYHCMLNLPGSNIEKDIEFFKELFEDENYKPDGIKIYPTQVVKGSELEKWYARGKYVPYSEEELVRLLIELKKMVPKYCRIMRVMREIPVSHLVAGTKRIDLRNILRLKMEKEGTKCNCIRCREVGYNKEVSKRHIKLCRIDYDASGGKEIFLSYEDTKNNVLISLLRLRIPGKSFRKEITDRTALIREIHTYGAELPIGKKSKESWQHKGYGKLLMKEAERIAKEEFGKNKIVVISGVGVRQYFVSLNYRRDGPYVSKNL